MEHSVDLTGSFTGDLHGVLREAAHRGPLARDAMTGVTVVLRHHDVEALAHDPRVHGVGLALFDLMGIADGPLRDWYGRLMFTNEGVEHRRIRSFASRYFTPGAVSTLRPRVADVAAEAIASLPGEGGDVVEVFSMLSTRITCHLLGVPDSEVPMLARWADALSPLFYIMSPEQITAATNAIVELLDYATELTRRRVQQPGSDLVTKLLEAESSGGRPGDTITMIAALILAAHDTTGSQIPCTIYVTLQHLDELNGVVHEPARLASAVSETMRLEPGIPLIPRTTVAPIELHGTQVPAGSTLFLCTAAAGRDTSAYPDPERFDADRFTRPDTSRLLSFGAGTHYCMGSSLAAIELEECMKAVVCADPPLRLIEEPIDVPWRIVLGRSPARLLVTSEPAVPAKAAAM